MNTRRQSLVVVMTTVNAPPASAQSFQSNWQCPVIVVGDQRTPTSWSHANVTYLGPESQDELFPDLSRRIPWNHYARKNLGYVWAKQTGAEAIFDTDDDNWPLASALPSSDFGHRTVHGPQRWLNSYAYFYKERIWPRGFPLTQVSAELPGVRQCNCSSDWLLIQGLANGTPDFDAVGHALYGEYVVQFREAEAPLEVPAGVFCPLNSQSTWFAREIFPLMYLPHSVGFRFADILRGIVAQPILWKLARNVVVSGPLVEQNRNPHIFEADFTDEVYMHTESQKIAELIDETVKKSNSVDVNHLLLNVYSRLVAADVCGSDEMLSLEAWIRAIN